MKLALLISLFTGSAFALDAVDQVYFGIEPQARVLAVKVIAEDQTLWRLWPDEVKIEQKDGDFTVTYKETSSPYRLLKAAQKMDGISADCRNEAAVLLSPPEKPVEEAKRITTVYYEMDPDTPVRIGVRAIEGLKILDARALRSEKDAQPGEPVELEPWTRVVFARVSYFNLVAGGPVGISDISVATDPQNGTVKLEALRPGLGAASQLHQDGLLSDACWTELSQTGLGLTERLSIRTLFTRRKQESVVVIPVDQKAARQFSVIAGGGLSLKGIGALD